MKSVCFFVCLLLLSFTVKSNYDYLVYSQVWTPTLCRYEVRCWFLDPLDTKFFLHGGWPTRINNYVEPAYCHPQIALFHPRHLNEVMDLENRMVEYWPSFSSYNRHFWDNQWLKHGTCTGWSRKRYINEVLGFYTAHRPHDLFTVLGNAGISPRYEDDELELHTRQDLQRAIRNLYRQAAPDGEVRDLAIGVDCAVGNHLSQIRVCKTPDAFDFIDCPYLGSCPDRFRFLKYRTTKELAQQTINKIKIGSIAIGLNSKIGSTTKESKDIGATAKESKANVHGRWYLSEGLNSKTGSTAKESKAKVPERWSIIYASSYDLNTVGSASLVIGVLIVILIYRRLVCHARKDLRLDVSKAAVSTEGSVKQIKIFTTLSDTGRKIENPDMLERIRLTIINNLLQYHLEFSELLAMGEVSGLKDPDIAIQSCIYRWRKALKDLGLDVSNSKGTVSTDGPVKQIKIFITQSDTGRKVKNPDMLERIRPESTSPEVFGLKDPEKMLDIEIGTHIQVKENGPKRSILLCIETADRPVLLVEVIKVIADVNIDVESVEIDAEGLGAKDEFHVSYGELH